MANSWTSSGEVAATSGPSWASRPLISSSRRRIRWASSRSAILVPTTASTGPAGRNREQLAIAVLVGGERLDSEQLADVGDHGGDVHVFVGVDTTDDLGGVTARRQVVARPFASVRDVWLPRRS